MVKNKKFYVTTPIYYPNDEPHIGSAYTTIAADVLARWHRLLGDEVYFLTGTDEHGQKIQESAEKVGLKPKDFVDKIAPKFIEAFKLLDISNNRFIRTTDNDHEKAVSIILQKIYDKKFIYKGKYEAYYCIACEQYLTKSELVDDKCPRHPNVSPEFKSEESYMFKLSSFSDKLLKLIKSGKYSIMPEARRKEIINFLESGLQDISISRLKTKVSWGVELPFDKNHTTYVWIDAFWNYVSGLSDKKNFSAFWPPDVQLMAKDIIRVHATIWPALLLALDYDLPKCLFVHGYFTIDGQKMSKSLGNVLSPVYLANKYGSDSVRYYVMRNISFGSDGDVSEKSLATRHNTELADKFGNLVSRVSALAEKYGLESVKLPVLSFGKLENIKKLFDNFELDKVLSEIFSYIDKCNEFVTDKKPWESGDKKALYELVFAIKNITILLSPFIPSSCDKVSKHFNFKISLDEINKSFKIIPIKKISILFNKVEFNEEVVKHNVNKSPIGIVSMSDLKFDDWSKVDLRVGKVVSVEEVIGSDKLLKLSVDFAEKSHRTIMSGIKKFYSIKELKGKKFVFLTNLEPRKIMGVSSEAMILASHSKDNKGDEKLSLFVPDKDADIGSKLG